MNNGKTSNKGFVALISVVFISLILLVVATTISIGGFYIRSNILESEFKEYSSDLAEGCIDSALIKIVQNTSYNPTNEIISACTIQKVTTSGLQKTIYAMANYQKSYTFLQVTIVTSDLSIVSWIESPN